MKKWYKSQWDFLNTILLRQVFLPDRGKDLDCHRVFMDGCRVLDIAGDRPAVARPDFRFLGTDPERDMSRHEIPCLLVGVGVCWEIRSSVKPELGHERVLPIDKCLLPDPWERFLVPGVGMVGKHGKPIMAFAGWTDKEYRSLLTSSDSSSSFFKNVLVGTSWSDTSCITT